MPRRATYRLQLTPEFGLAEAAGVIPYLGSLGISHLYLSPLFEAVPGSRHGYDVTDPTRVRAEVGGEAGLRRLAGAAARTGIELILDIVPNHMAADEHNPWWWDVMKRGRDSAFARYFDIDWRRGEGRLILPVLDGSLRDALDAGAVSVERGSPSDPAEPVLRAGGRRLPLRDAAGPLESVLDRQPYRLVPWREAGRLVNYRRFFDVNDLVAVRVEDERVFEATHGLVTRLLAAGTVAGVRVDHVDGLRAPGAYLRRLRGLAPEAWILVEKILAPAERLPRWPVDGTTGYDFLRVVDALWVDAEGFRRLEDDAIAAGAAPDRFATLSRDARREVLPAHFGGDLDAMVRLARDATGDAIPQTRLRAAVVELIAGLGVYRTYLGDDAAPQSRAHLREALEAAAGRADDAALQAVAGALADGDDDTLRARWEQLSSPVMAKGVEDTALYRHVAMLGLNEVGCEPVPPADAAGDLARLLDGRAPATLSATATHDAKLGEDTRARLAVLTELGGEWISTLDRWRRRHASLRVDASGGPAPGPADEHRLYQALLGTWPAGAADPAGLIPRLTAYLVKAAREAGLRTGWHETDDEYEAALAAFTRRLLEGPEGGPFRDEARAWRDRVAVHGCVNSLARTALKSAAPGVPDFYQGTERWDLTLVDPDNRRPVDFAALGAALDSVRMPDAQDRRTAVESMAAAWPDGRIKTYLTARLLALRASRPDLFTGPARLLATGGEHAGHVVALARRAASGTLVVITPRLSAELDVGRFPVGPRVWGDTHVTLPGPEAPQRLEDQLTGADTTARAGRVAVGEVLEPLPVAVLATGRR